MAAAWIPRSVITYLLGSPKRSVLYFAKPRERSCLVAQIVGHPELFPSNSATSGFVSPSLLVASAFKRVER